MEAAFPAEALAAVAAERFRIAKIAEIPPQQAKAGLAGDPGCQRLPKLKSKISPREARRRREIQSLPEAPECQD